MGTSSSRNLSVLLNNSDDCVESPVDPSKTRSSTSCSDPRSPSAVIYRTPIQRNMASNSSIFQKIELQINDKSGPLSVSEMYHTPIQLRSQPMSADGMSLIHRKPNTGVGLDGVAMNIQNGLWLMDPRSPSIGIDRTPIQVQAHSIEDNSTLSVEKSCHFLEKCAMLVDPRSPTDGIFRTPIQIKTIAVGMSPSQVVRDHSSKNQIREKEVSMTLSNPEIPIALGTMSFQKFIDPRSPSAGIDRTPLASSLKPVSMDQSVSSESISFSPADLIDPRSPTAGINRTPLKQIAKTMRFNQELTSAGISSAASTNVNFVVADDVDPRSPTAEINRTPLPLITDSLTTSVIVPRLNLDYTPITFDTSVTRMEPDPRSPTSGVDRNPIFFNLSVSTDTAPITNTGASSTPILPVGVQDTAVITNHQAFACVGKHDALTNESVAMETDEDDQLKPVIDKMGAIDEINAMEGTSPCAMVENDAVRSPVKEVKKRKTGSKVVEGLPSMEYRTTKNDIAKVMHRSSFKKLDVNMTTEKRSPLTTRNVINLSLNSSKNQSSPLVARAYGDQPRMLVQRRQARRIESMKLTDASSVASSVSGGHLYVRKMVTTDGVCRTPTDKENI